MFLNNFSVRVPEGTEIPGGYVKMAHGRQFTIVLGNKRYEHADATLYVDGGLIGTFRVPAKSTIRVERPLDLAKKFTFYKLGTPEAAKAQLDSRSPDPGLIRVVFVPEVAYRYVNLEPFRANVVYNMNADWKGLECTTRGGSTLTSSVPKGVSAGGVGLSGRSGQTFVNSEAISHDDSQRTTIHLRLVCDESDDIQPLTSRSTPVPPRI